MKVIISWIRWASSFSLSKWPNIPKLFILHSELFTTSWLEESSSNDSIGLGQREEQGLEEPLEGIPDGDRWPWATNLRRGTNSRDRGSWRVTTSRSRGISWTVCLTSLSSCSCSCSFFFFWKTSSPPFVLAELLSEDKQVQGRRPRGSQARGRSELIALCFKLNLHILSPHLFFLNKG